MISQRLKQLRLARGLSLEELAAQMDGAVTKQALSKYELGIARPSQRMLNRLAAALGVKAAYLWSDPVVRVEFIAYRKHSGLLKREQEKVECRVAHDLEERVRLQDLLHDSDSLDIPFQTRSIQTEEEAETAAREIREEWRLGVDPIASLTGVLEDRAIHVIEIEADEKFDGICAVARGDGERVQAAALVTRRGVAGERQRLNIVHELGHLVLQFPVGINEEKAAFRFGAAFLAPAELLYREVGRSRTLIQMSEILLLKQRFGLGIQALLYRLKDLGIITASCHGEWIRLINVRGWRKCEPQELPPEQPQS